MLFRSAVVAASGADYTTIQGADDDLDAGAFSLYVKQGSYAGWETSTNNARIEIEPGTTITSDITLSGNNIELLIGAGCDIQGKVTATGTDCHIQCENGVDLDGVRLGGARGFFCGGGWDTLVDGGTSQGIRLYADDCIAQNARAQSTPGGGNTVSAVRVDTNARCVVRNIQVVDSDRMGIMVISGSPTDTLIEGCVVLAADEYAYYAGGHRTKIVGCYGTADGSAVVHMAAAGDNSVVTGNVFVQQSANLDVIEINSSGENCTVVGNRLTGYSGTGEAVDDDSGTSTVADNDTTA